MALTKISNNSLSAISSLPASIPTGALTLISTQTASASASIEFTSGIDSTYDSYVFKFINIHPSASNAEFEMNLSTDGGSNYNVTKTSTFFRSIHAENDSFASLAYRTGEDLAQSTANQIIMYALNNDNDSNGNGFFHLYNPSSTTYVKHFISNCTGTSDDGGSNRYDVNYFCAGYGNTTSAINAVKFQMASGNIDDGIIKMYGVS